MACFDWTGNTLGAPCDGSIPTATFWSRPLRGRMALSASPLGARDPNTRCSSILQQERPALKGWQVGRVIKRATADRRRRRASPPLSSMPPCCPPCRSRWAAGARHDGRRAGAGAGGPGQDRRRAVVSGRRRHRQGPQYRDGARRRSTAASSASISRKARTSSAATCSPRSIRPPTRPSSTRPIAKKALDEVAARQRPSATSSATPDSAATSSRRRPSTRSARSSISSPRRSRSTMRPSPTPRRFSTTRPSSRRSTAAPASAWSTRATWCAARMPPGIVVITQLRPISVLFTLPQQQLAQVNKALAAGTLAVEALDADGKIAARSRHAAGRRQPGRPDDRHGPDEGRVPQRQPAALARPVRQRAPAHRHAEAGGGGADARCPARPQRHLRLCRAARTTASACAPSRSRIRPRRRP